MKELDMSRVLSEYVDVLEEKLYYEKELEVYKKALELTCGELRCLIECEDCPKEIYNKCVIGTTCLIDNEHIIVEYYLKKAREENG